MSHTASEVSVFKPTNELRQVFGEPALVGSEKLEVYDEFLSLIASVIKPTDPVGYLLTKDITDWSWEMRREQAVKAEIIKHYQKEIVAELIKTLAPAGQPHAVGNGPCKPREDRRGLGSQRPQRPEHPCTGLHQRLHPDRRHRQEDRRL